MRQASGRNSLWAGGLWLALVLLLCASTAATKASAAAVPISDGTLSWGIKTSWAQYVGIGELSGGVTATPGETVGIFQTWTYDFPVTGGSYDPETKTTTIEAEGTIHWQKYKGTKFSPPPGYTGSLDIFVLDVTFTDPRLTIGAAGSVITVEAIARKQATWELIDLGRVAIAELDAAAVTPTEAVGTTSWEGVPAALTEVGAEDAFGGGYRTGQIVDPVSFSYSGPGGAPDFAERWTDPDSTGLTQVHNTLFGMHPSFDFLWEQPADGIVHNVYLGTEERMLRAIDVRTGEVLGEPVVRKGGWANYTIADPETGTLYYRSATGSPVDSYVRWNGEDEVYEEGAIPPLTVKGSPIKALWDPVRGRAFTVNLQVPEGVGTTDYENHVWYLNVYTRQQDNSFSEARYRLPSAPTGWNRRWYDTTTNRGAVLPDGSVILLPGTVNSPAPGAVELDTVPIPRITIDEAAGTATVAPVPGASVPHVELSARKPDRIFASAEGWVSLVREGSSSTRPTRVRQYEIEQDGTLEPLGGEVQVPVALSKAVAFDPVDGTVWNLDSEPKRLTAVRGGRLAGTHSFPAIHTKSPYIGVLPDQSLYVVSSDGQPLGLGETIHGIAYYRWDGYSPAVTAQPDDESVDVAIGGSGPVQFTAAAIGTPAPSVQWQRRAPGSSRFADLDGETGPTLEVEATAADDGAAYRAVFANAAGSLATDPAALEVRYAPSVSFDPAAQAVVAGDDAAFSILAVGSPDPAIVWQRRVNGFWEAVDPDSGDFEVDGNTLVVKDANLAMSGAEFRARLTNPLGVAFTKEATLTVAEPPPALVTFGSGHLDWGVKQSFRNYIGGGIAHGSYTASSGATVNPDGTIRFDVLGGSYDTATGSGEIATDGVVRFTGHDNGSGPLLDLKIADPRLTIAGGTGTLFADVVSRGLADGGLESYPDIALATLDLSGAGPAPIAGGLAFAPIAAALTAPGAPAFADFYPAGTALDPLALHALYGAPRQAPGDPEPGTGIVTSSAPVATTPPARRAKPRRCRPGKRKARRGGKMRCVTRKAKKKPKARVGKMRQPRDDQR